MPARGGATLGRRVAVRRRPGRRSAMRPIGSVEPCRGRRWRRGCRAMRAGARGCRVTPDSRRSCSAPPSASGRSASCLLDLGTSRWPRGLDLRHVLAERASAPPCPRTTPVDRRLHARQRAGRLGDRLDLGEQPRQHAERAEHVGGKGGEGAEPDHARHLTRVLGPRRDASRRCRGASRRLLLALVALVVARPRGGVRGLRAARRRRAAAARAGGGDPRGLRHRGARGPRDLGGRPGRPDVRRLPRARAVRDLRRGRRRRPHGGGDGHGADRRRHGRGRRAGDRHDDPALRREPARQRAARPRDRDRPLPDGPLRADRAVRALARAGAGPRPADPARRDAADRRARERPAHRRATRSSWPARRRSSSRASASSRRASPASSPCATRAGSSSSSRSRPR